MGPILLKILASRVSLFHTLFYFRPSFFYITFCPHYFTFLFELICIPSIWISGRKIYSKEPENRSNLTNLRSGMGDGWNWLRILPMELAPLNFRVSATGVSIIQLAVSVKLSLKHARVPTATRSEEYCA